MVGGSSNESSGRIKKSMIRGKKTPLFDADCFKKISKGNAIKSGLTTMIGEASSLLLRAGSMLILARMLMPEDFGLIGMATVLMAIAERFKDLGLSTATIQREEISQEQASSLFWINVGLGVLFMLGFAGISKPVAIYYGDDRVMAIVIALSLCFLFGGMTVQHQALLRRQMRFGRLATVFFFSELFSIGMAVAMAMKGFNYWALVGKEIVRGILIAGGIFLTCPWIPGRPRRTEGLASMLHFGKHITGFNVILFIARSLDQILIGKIYGATTLGFYRQASQLVALPVGLIQHPINYVAEPFLSKIQYDHQEYNRYYIKIISHSAFVFMPMIMYLIIFFEEVTFVVLGPKWIPSSFIFRILLIGAFIQPIVSTCGFAMVACGKSAQYFRWGLFNSIAILTAVSIGILWGAKGVAWAITINTYITLIPSVWYGLRETPVTIGSFYKSLRIPAFSSFIMGLSLFGISSLFPGNKVFPMLAISLVLGGIVYGSVIMILPGGKEMLSEYYAHFKAVFKKDE
jgi:O-antigen/teichoic acid export membrane protein